MIRPETILTLPLEAARKAGEAVLWLTERAVPPNPDLPKIGANITIYEGTDPDYRRAA